MRLACSLKGISAGKVMLMWSQRWRSIGSDAVDAQALAC